MRRVAALVAGALSLACAGRPPASSPVEPSFSQPSAFTASFEARASAGAGRVRFRGVLAASAGGRLRVEAVGPSVASPVLLVAADGLVSAALPAQRLHYRGPAAASFLEMLTGVPVLPGEIAGILTGEAAAPPPGCTLSPGARLGAPAKGLRPKRLSLRCGEARLELRLRDVRPISGITGPDPFALLPLPPGFSEADLDAFVRALRGSPPAADTERPEMRP